MPENGLIPLNVKKQGFLMKRYLLPAILLPLLLVLACFSQIITAQAGAIVKQDKFVEYESIAQVIKEGLENNLELKAAELSKNITAAQHLKAKSLFPKDPEIEFEYETDGPGGETSSFTIGVSQEIEIAGQRKIRKETAKLDAIATAFSIKQVEKILIYNLKLAFYDLLFAQEKKNITEELRSLDENFKNISGERLNKGDISELEHELSVLEYDRALLMSLMADGEINQAMLKLNRLMGGDENRKIRLNTKKQQIKPVNQTLDELKKSAFANSYNLKAILNKLKAKRLEKMLLKKAKIVNPSISLHFTEEKSKIDGGDFRGDQAIIGAIDSINDKNSLIGLSISFPLPVSLRYKADILKARYEIEKLSEEIKAMKQNIVFGVLNAYSKLKNTEKQIDLSNAIITRLENNLKLIREAYLAGEIDLQTLLLEKNKLLQAKLEQLTATKTYFFTIAKLQHITGTN